MARGKGERNAGAVSKRYPEKCLAEEEIFSHIHRGNRIFVGTGCGEPQHLVRSLINYVETNPLAFFDTEVFHVWTLGVAPYTDERFRSNFRHNSFFIGNNTREAVNQGLADYTPVFLSQVPDLFRRRLVPIDVALVQTSPPDDHGYVSLGVSVDITKAAVENAALVIGQINSHMPRVHGDTFVHIRDLDFVVHHDESLLEYRTKVADDVAHRIGAYVARIVEDGDTIQVGYGSMPDAILANLRHKSHLGVHTELLTDGIIQLMREGAVDNTRKSIDRGKTVATFCLGSKETYTYLHDNPAIVFRTIDYTNDPLIIAGIKNMTAINTALQIDLTGQATAESIGRTFYSGIGGSADFMRGAILSSGGKTILAIQSTAKNGAYSRIVPFVNEGGGVTFGRGDLHYVVTEYGVAHIHGKNVRERAMDLIAIAHPDFRPWLIEEAKAAGLIYRDQTFIPGKEGEYPESLETHRTTKTGLRILLRPVKISDEPLLKDFFYSLSDRSIYRRFFSPRTDMPHEYLQKFVVVDYSKQMTLLVVIEREEREECIGLGQYSLSEGSNTGELAVVVKDAYQNQGVGSTLLSYLTLLAKKQGLFGLTAGVLIENKPMLSMLRRVFPDTAFAVERRIQAGVVEMTIAFREK